MLKTTTLVTTMLVALAGVARAQAPGETPPTPPPDDQGAYNDDGSDAADDAATPPSDQPTDAVPSMPQDIPSPPDTQVQVAPSDTSDGQWVYTDQYGWIWMPYGDQYVQSTDVDSGAGYAYVYYPSSGWGWVSAPWVVGWGPRPYFGHWGYAHYHWYPHRWVGHGYYGGGRYYGGRGYYGGRAYDHRYGHGPVVRGGIPRGNYVVHGGGHAVGGYHGGTVHVGGGYHGGAVVHGGGGGGYHGGGVVHGGGGGGYHGGGGGSHGGGGGHGGGGHHR